ncbi:UNVERIFIED_CONTAM: Urocanate hydratase [Gekko kuhli]
MPTQIGSCGYHFCYSVWNKADFCLSNQSYFAGADVRKEGANKGEFRYPSYVQHIMGDIFSLGFGPFRWVCTSSNPEDLVVTDDVAKSVLEDAVLQEGGA